MNDNPFIKPDKPVLPDPLPPPGLDGTYSGSCIVCLQGTDTALGLAGEPEWIAAAYMHLGIPKDQAMTMVEAYVIPNGEQLGDDRYQVAARVCQACASKAGMKVALYVDGGVLPVHGQAES